RDQTQGIKRKIFLTLGCEISGKCKTYEHDLVHKVFGSKKTWMFLQTLDDHAYIGKLRGEENSLLSDMTKNMIKQVVSNNYIMSITYINSKKSVLELKCNI
ncbi:hypothetical protein CR513_11342, partial [Mucuna pruriens]